MRVDPRQALEILRADDYLTLAPLSRPTSLRAAASDADGGARWSKHPATEEPAVAIAAREPNDSADRRFAAELVAVTPRVRAFARSLCRNGADADDLVQSALLKAWAARDHFQAGTNLAAWTSTILMNEFRTTRRRAWRISQLDADAAADWLQEAPSQTGRLELDELRRAMLLLSREQRAALLVGAAGLSYEEASAIFGVPVGTVKSRVNRARDHLKIIYEAGGIPVDGKPPRDAAGFMDDAARSFDPARRARPASLRSKGGTRARRAEIASGVARRDGESARRA